MSNNNFSKIGKAQDDISLIEHTITDGKLKTTLTKADGTTIVSNEIDLSSAMAPAFTSATVTVVAATSNYGGSESVHQSDSESGSWTLLGSAYTRTAETFTFTATQPYVRIYNVTSTSGNVEATGTSSVYKLTGDATFNVFSSCLTGDTLITMADGSERRIDTLTAGEQVLSYNPDTSALEPDTITYSDSDMVKTHTEYDVWMLSDGTKIKTVLRHRFYNVERQSMVYMDEWNIGEHFRKSDGTTPSLVAHEKVAESVRHYTIFTDNQNYFANGCLSGNRHTKPLRLEEKIDVE